LTLSFCPSRFNVL